MTKQAPAGELRAAAARLRRIAASDLDWPWVRHVSPALASPLAALLDRAAERFTNFPDLGPDVRLSLVEYELAVARVVLGGGRG